MPYSKKKEKPSIPKDTTKSYAPAVNDMPEVGDLDGLCKYFIPTAIQIAKAHCRSIRYPDIDEYISVAIYYLPIVCERITNKKTAVNYVKDCLRGVLRNHLRDNGRRIRLPRGILDRHSRITRYFKNNTQATETQAKEELKISEEKWQECQEAMNMQFTPIVEIIPDSHETLAEENAAIKEGIKILAELDDTTFKEMYRIYLKGGKVIKPNLRQKIEQAKTKLDKLKRRYEPSTED